MEQKETPTWNSEQKNRYMPAYGRLRMLTFFLPNKLTMTFLFSHRRKLIILNVANEEGTPRETNGLGDLDRSSLPDAPNQTN